MNNEPYDLFNPPPRKNGGDKARDEAHSAIDELIRSALAYHTPKRFVELVNFARRLPNYSPFNCMLLHIQNPQALYVARPQQWADLGRKIKPGARPLLILAPMHPVMFVFDVTDTEGRDLPPHVQQAIEDPFGVEGLIDSRTWTRALRGCEKMRINVSEEPLGSTLAGDVRLHIQAPFSYLLRLNSTHEQSVRFATLAHELGHLFCGHLGKLDTDCWENREPADLAGRELEAEAVAHLVASRFGLRTASKKYLSLYLTSEAALPQFSMESILTAAGAVEDLARGRLPGKERSRRKRAKNEPAKRAKR